MIATLTVLASFNGTNGNKPLGSLIADAAGNLYGTTAFGGQHDVGTVFEIAKTTNGYASTPTTLATALNPWGSLVTDTKGNLYGTTAEGGANGDGTVFEIAKTASGYATTPTTLVSFNGSNGGFPFGSLIIDAAGHLYGTTAYGGANGDGTVFEIAKTANGYATTPTTLVSFNGTEGNEPRGSLIADATGHLYGTTTFGGANNNGTVFEITGSGYAVSAMAALSAQQNGQLTSPVSISDTAANVASNLDPLRTLAAAGKLSSITLTDSNIPTLTITPIQLTNDVAALNDISSDFALSIAAPAANTTISGLAGHGNTAVFSGSASQYTITASGNGATFTISGNGVTDQVSNVQALKFSDYTNIVACQTAPAPGAVSLGAGHRALRRSVRSRSRCHRSGLLPELRRRPPRHGPHPIRPVLPVLAGIHQQYRPQLCADHCRRRPVHR